MSNLACDDYRYVIVGGGNAGVSAAQAIREIDKESPLIMISDERDLPYRRPMLTKNFSLIDSSDPYAMHPSKWYSDLNITMIHDRVLSIYPSTHSLALSSGKSLSFGSLILAVGAKCFIPPFKGVSGSNVVSIRKTDDVRKLVELLKNANSAAVIGGGVLGMEAAWEIRRMGKTVHVIEASSSLMKRNLDNDASEMLLRQAENNGVDIILNGKTSSIEASGIVLEDGRNVACDVVIISCGIRPDVTLAEDAGIVVERAIVVDDHMRTNLLDIYACGDCAQFNGFSAGIWPVAGAMGKIAGCNAAGTDAVYSPKAYAVMMNALGTGLYSAGSIASENLVFETVQNDSFWARIFFSSGEFCGFIMIGDTKKAFSLSPLLERKASKDEVLAIVC